MTPASYLGMALYLQAAFLPLVGVLAPSHRLILPLFYSSYPLTETKGCLPRLLLRTLLG